jgi:hypothetical protein
MREGDSLACKFPVPCYSLKTGKFSLLNNRGMGNNELGQQRGKKAGNSNSLFRTETGNSDEGLENANGAPHRPAEIR